MSDRDKKLLVYLGSLIILAIAYFLVGRPYLDKIEQLATEKTQLEAELHQKREAYENKETFEKGVVEARDKIQAIIEEFPEDNTDEKSIMFASHAETDIPIWFTQMRFEEETKSMISGQETESASDVEQEQLEEDIAVAEGEAVPEEPEGEDGLESGETDGDTGISDLMYRATDLGLTFECKYDGFKTLLAYIRDYEDRMVIKDIDVSYNADSDIVAGNMTLSQYAILGPNRILPEVETDVDALGTDNIFLNSNHGGTILELLADIASDFLAVIMGELPESAVDELGTDYFVKVNAVTDNTNGKTVGRADDPMESTYLTSSANKKEDVTFKVSGSGGSYSVYYKVGKSEYTDTIEKASDGKIYIRVVSTARVGDDDNSALSLRVANDSDIPVVVNVEGDDPGNPRVNITERSGNVTVNGGN